MQVVTDHWQSARRVDSATKRCRLMILLPHRICLVFKRGRDVILRFSLLSWKELICLKRCFKILPRHLLSSLWSPLKHRHSSDDCDGSSFRMFSARWFEPATAGNHASTLDMRACIVRVPMWMDDKDAPLPHAVTLPYQLHVCGCAHVYVFMRVCKSS